MEKYFSCGKLMLCGEYAVLQGATALALPTKKGQWLEVQFTKEIQLHQLNWHSYDMNGNIWFEAEIQLPYFIVISTSNPAIAYQLVRFLITAKSLNPLFLSEIGNYNVATELEFDLSSGFGSSSTLINNIAQWANINAFSLHFGAFAGSGYDISVAQANKPILYHYNPAKPAYEIVEWNKKFSDQLYIIHLGKKQNSREEVKARKDAVFSRTAILELNNISKALTTCSDIFEFCLLLELAENIISSALDCPTIKQQLFPDFNGTIKSLGAWGGDCILAVGSNVETYFKSKSYSEIQAFSEIVKVN